MSLYLRIEPIFPNGTTSRYWPDLPDSTNYGENKVEVCQKAFPINVVCKVCCIVIEPSMIFIFSCRHYYHGYCARKIAHLRIRSMECKKCTYNISKNDWKRLRNLPTSLPRGFNAGFVPE